MIFVESISNALFTAIASDSTIVNSGFIVVHEEAFRSDGGLFPWAGVYAGEFIIEPFLASAAQPWQATIDLDVIVAEQSMGSGNEAAMRLSAAQRLVLTVVNSNKNLDGTVQIITNIAVTPIERPHDTEDTVYANLITLTYEVKA